MGKLPFQYLTAYRLRFHDNFCDSRSSRKSTQNAGVICKVDCTFKLSRSGDPEIRHLVLVSEFRHILKAGLDPRPWTLDYGLWTLDSVFFFLSKLYPPLKKNLYLPPEKPLSLPHETPPSPHEHFFPQI